MIVIGTGDMGGSGPLTFSRGAGTYRLSATTYVNAGVAGSNAPRRIEVYNSNNDLIYTSGVPRSGDGIDTTPTTQLIFYCSTNSFRIELKINTNGAGTGSWVPAPGNAFFWRKASGIRINQNNITGG